MRPSRLTLEDKIAIKRDYKPGLGGKMGKQYGGVTRQYVHIIKNDPSIVVTAQNRFWGGFCHRVIANIKRLFMR